MDYVLATSFDGSLFHGKCLEKFSRAPIKHPRNTWLNVNYFNLLFVFSYLIIYYLLVT